ncbi:MAG TPA: matrixin family metalloprotease [Candidatus Binatia bacterium]
MLVFLGYWLRVFLAPCGTPLHYRIGTIDGRFRVTRSELRSALEKAEAMWEGPLGQNLFEYDEKATLVVNLQFDTRQDQTQDTNRRKADIDSTSTSAADARSRYDAANSRYESDKSAYSAAEASLNAKIDEFNREVQTGVGDDVQVQARREQLDRGRMDLDAKRHDLNDLGERVNTLRRRYNELADSINTDIAAINRNSGREFEQGLYTRNSEGTHIDIFEFQDRDDLVRVLAHELGHALGLEHSTDSDSLMYALHTQEHATVTAPDLAALRRRCRL